MELLTQDDGGYPLGPSPVIHGRGCLFLFWQPVQAARSCRGRFMLGGLGYCGPPMSLEGGRAEEGRLVVCVGGGGETRRYILERSRAASSQSSQSKEAKQRRQQRQHQTVVSSAPRRCVSHMATFAVYHGAIPNGVPGR
jgi:hypothetical protein